MKEGDSIGVVHRHETSSTDELGRCHPDRWMFCKVLLSCNSAMRYGWNSITESKDDSKHEQTQGRKQACVVK